MSVRCEKCGEELLGAVNRCWRCGQHIATPPSSTGGPPLKDVQGSSPERPNGVVEQERAAGRMPGYPRHVSAFGGAVAALALSLFAFGVGGISTVPVIGVFLALLGLLLGLWGLLGPRRKWAAVGLALCLLALGLSGVRSAVQLYRVLHGGERADGIEQTLSPDERQQLDFE